MELVKKNLHTSALKCEKQIQITVDEDFNIPDQKEDIESVITKYGVAVIDECVCDDNQVKLSGSVMYLLMYKTAGRESEVEFMSGEIPFEQKSNFEGAKKGDKCEVELRLEDITINEINSRKIEVRALVEIQICTYAKREDVVCLDIQNGKGIECQYKNLELTTLEQSKHDIFRIKEDLDIPENKPNIDEILWWNVSLRNVDVKIKTDLLKVSGEVEIFAIYKGVEDRLPIQYVYVVRTFNEEIECIGIDEDMIGDVGVSLGKGEVSIRQDADGEDRVIGIDYPVNLEIKMYSECSCRVINDVFSPQAKLCPYYTSIDVDNLLLRNTAVTKVNQRKHVNGGKVMQICHVFGDIFIENIVMEDDICVSGIIKPTVIYISSGEEPLCSFETEIPFECIVEMPEDIKNKKELEEGVRVSPRINYINANLLNGEEMEIKAEAALSISVLEKEQLDVISDIEVLPLDLEEKASLPSIVGYVVKEGDTIWSVARRFYSTTSSIKSVNELESDELTPNQKIIIVKS